VVFYNSGCCGYLNIGVNIGWQVYEFGGATGGGGGKGGGKPAKGRDKDAPLFSEVCEACKLYLDADVEIPLSLLARLIKFRLLIIKDTDVKNRKARVLRTS